MTRLAGNKYPIVNTSLSPSLPQPQVFIKAEMASEVKYRFDFDFGLISNKDHFFSEILLQFGKKAIMFF